MRESCTEQVGPELLSAITYDTDIKDSGSITTGEALLKHNVAIHDSDPQLSSQHNSLVANCSKSQFLDTHEAASTWVHGSRPAEDLSGNQAPDLANPLARQPVIDNFLVPPGSDSGKYIAKLKGKVTKNGAQTSAISGPSMDRSPVVDFRYSASIW